MTPMETFESRLRRFLVGTPDELFSTLLNSINNFFNNQLEKAGEHQLDELIFLGTHAVMQTVSEKMFGISGVAGTEFYLKNFVDDTNIPDRQFSAIAADIHHNRNVKAHLWLSSRLHDFAIDYRHSEGWKRQSGTLSINPTVFLEQFLLGFKGPIWRWDRLASRETFVVQKYLYLRDWLELPKKDAIRLAIETLDPSSPTLSTDEAMIRADIAKRYSL